MKRLIPFLIGALAAACGGDAANDDTPMLHPVEKACVEYELSGALQNGTMTRCQRDYAYEQYEIQNVTMGIGPFQQTQQQHNITIGDTIYAIDLQKNTATKTKNPVYEGLVGALADSSPEEMSAAFLAAMGFNPTGEEKTIAGHACAVYASGMIGTACLTPGGLMLEQSFMGNTTRATSVTLDSGGDPANYTKYEGMQVTEGPDLSNLQDLMQGQQP